MEEERYNKKTVGGGSRKGDVAQSACHVKDKRLRRACGILDTACCQCYRLTKGLFPTPVNQG